MSYYNTDISLLDKKNASTQTEAIPNIWTVFQTRPPSHVLKNINYQNIQILCHVFVSLTSTLIQSILWLVFTSTPLSAKQTIEKPNGHVVLASMLNLSPQDLKSTWSAPFGTGPKTLNFLKLIFILLFSHCKIVTVIVQIKNVILKEIYNAEALVSY